MASVRKWRNGWQVRWYDPQGRQRSKSFKRKTDAKQFSNRVEVEKQQGTYVDPELGKLLFADWAHAWLDSKINLRASSWARDESYLRNHVIPAFGGYPLARITKLQIQAWVRELSEAGMHPSTVKECYRILRSVMNEAVDSRLIVESPCRKVILPRIPRVEQRFLTAEQVELLANAIDQQFQALVYAAAYLGCRWGELAGLQRQNLDLDKAEVRIVGTLEEVPGGVRYVQETKTSASRRAIIVPGFLNALLGSWLKSGPESEFVFCGRDGAPLRRSNFRKRFWKPALEKAELDTTLRFHDLRHTCASLLIKMGAHPKEIQAHLGHSSITTTLDRYGHLMPSLGQELATRLHRGRLAVLSDMGMDQTWTNDDEDVIPFPLLDEDSGGGPAPLVRGRLRVRTPDRCVVSATHRNRATSGKRRSRWSTAVFKVA